MATKALDDTFDIEARVQDPITFQSVMVDTFGGFVTVDLRRYDSDETISIDVTGNGIRDADRTTEGGAVIYVRDPRAVRVLANVLAAVADEAERLGLLSADTDESEANAS